jgi:mRNA interferase HigB
MKVIGLNKIDSFCKTYSDSRSPLADWLITVKKAKWQSPLDVIVRFANASFVGDRRVIFNIKGNKYRLDAKISYKLKTVLIKRIGTHSEYNKWVF